MCDKGMRPKQFYSKTNVNITLCLLVLSIILTIDVKKGGQTFGNSIYSADCLVNIQYFITFTI